MFPGIGLGIIVSNTIINPNDLFLITSQALANSISEQNLQDGTFYP